MSKVSVCIYVIYVNTIAKFAKLNVCMIRNKFEQEY